MSLLALSRVAVRISRRRGGFGTALLQATSSSSAQVQQAHFHDHRPARRNPSRLLLPPSPAPTTTTLLPLPRLWTAQSFSVQVGTRGISTDEKDGKAKGEEEEEEEDVSALQRMEGETLGHYFKRLTKDYWYVLVPVHLVTSTVWIGTFYLMVKSGVDIPGLLERMGTSHEKIEKIGHSKWAHLLLAYACYKIATPARYTVTVAGTTLTVRHLRRKGYLRTTRQVRDKFKDKTGDIKDRMEEEWERAWKVFAKKKSGRKSS